MNIKDLKVFLLSGRSSISVKSNISGLVFSYKISQKFDRKQKKDLWHVYASFDNKEYKFLGTIFDSYKLYFGNNCEFFFTEEDEDKQNVMNKKIVKGFAYFWKLIMEEKEDANITYWHHGVCSRCGQKLTDETSVEKGLGPICRIKLGL